MRGRGKKATPQHSQRFCFFFSVEWEHSKHPGARGGKRWGRGLTLTLTLPPPPRTREKGFATPVRQPKLSAPISKKRWAGKEWMTLR